MSDEYVNRLFSSGALDGKIEALQSQIKALLQLRAMDAAELEALRADAAMHKRAVEVLFEDDSGDLDYIKWYIRTNVLEARKGAA